MLRSWSRTLSRSLTRLSKSREMLTLKSPRPTVRRAKPKRDLPLQLSVLRKVKALVSNPRKRTTRSKTNQRTNQRRKNRSRSQRLILTKP